MAQRLADAGYPDYRRSDTVLVRLLSRRPRSIGQLGEALGVTRQAARKLVAGLERRDYASTARDGRDARQLNVSLTPRGEAFARVIAVAIDELNQGLSERVDAAQLQAADVVLRATLPDRASRERVARLVPPPE